MRLVKPEHDSFLRRVKGVIHIGANSGQERYVYENRGLHVLWIEPIPEVFKELQSNIASFPRQRALQALLTDVDDKSYRFNVANNGGQSSSILDMKHHKEIWPDVAYSSAIQLVSTTLASLVQKEKIDLSSFNALVLDAQGAELLILKGAEKILNNFRFIKTEVADFESYAGCCQLDELQQFMTARGFREYTRHAFANSTRGGQYYDVTFKRR